MKRLIALLLILSYSIFLLAGCGGSEPPTPEPEPVPVVNPEPTPTPEPAPEPEPTPEPEPEPVVWEFNIPNGGGDVDVLVETEFLFIPDYSGAWQFKTSAIDGNPRSPFVEVFDIEGNIVTGQGDFTVGIFDAFFLAYLTEGEQYVVSAGFKNEDRPYKLSVTQAQILELGDYTHLIEQLTMFSIIPENTGTWTFFSTENINTSDNGLLVVPFIHLYESSSLIKESVEIPDSDNNTTLTVELTAGVEYVLFVGTWQWGEEKIFTLVVLPEE
jgi:hypothetical protein